MKSHKMTYSLDALPLELLQTILTQLSIRSLLSFARTSRSNYAIAIQALTSLELAVFPRRIYCDLAFLSQAHGDDVTDSESEDDERCVDAIHPSRILFQHVPEVRSALCSRRDLYQIARTTKTPNKQSVYTSFDSPEIASVIRKHSTDLTGHERKMLIQRSLPNPMTLRNAQIASQNNLAAAILASPSLRNLKSLTLNLYSLSSFALASTLAQFETLRELDINCSHPYISDTTLPAHYWRVTPDQGSGSTLWNVLAGVGSNNTQCLRLTKLRRLALTRVGITSTQLRKWIAANPELRRLELRMVRGVDLEFACWLSDYVAFDLGSRMEKIRLEECHLLDCKEQEEFEWITRIAEAGTVNASSQLRELSLKGCPGVEETALIARILNKVEICHTTDTTRFCMPGIRKVISPKGVVFRQRGIKRYRGNGAASPAPSMNDEWMVGGWKSRESNVMFDTRLWE